MLRIRIRYYKTLGTSLKNSPLSPPYHVHITTTYIHYFKWLIHIHMYYYACTKLFSHFLLQFFCPFFLVTKLLYNSKCPYVWNVLGKMLFSRLLYKIDGWNFLSTFSLIWSIIKYKISMVVRLFSGRFYLLLYFLSHIFLFVF